LDILEEEFQVLIDLGLTLLQAKVYLGLVQIGVANVKTISQVSRVARPDVYRTLSKLQRLGLVEKVIARTATYRAVPPEDGLSILLHRRTMKCVELKSKIEALLSKLRKINNVTDFQKGCNFVLVPSKEALIKKLRKAIDGAQTSIDVSTSCKRLRYACYSLSDALQKAWDRRVKGRAIINETEENQLETIKGCWKAPSAEIRYFSAVPRTVMAIYDKKEVFIFTKPAANLKESPALWSNDPSLVGMAADRFETLWNNAKQGTAKSISTGQKVILRKRSRSHVAGVGV
jgi:sugar-specific transcriptional regulator TrmB